MPQLDKISFISQYFWITISFFFLYFFVLNFRIVSIFRSLRLRTLLNELYNFRLFKVDYDRGIISFTNRLLILYFGKVYSDCFHYYLLFFKKAFIFHKLNISNFNIFFFWTYIIDYIKNNAIIIKDFNDIEIDEL